MTVHNVQYYRSISDGALPSELTAAQWHEMHRMIDGESRKGSYTLEGFERDSEFYKFIETLNHRQIDTLKRELSRQGFTIQPLYGLRAMPLAMSWFVTWYGDEDDQTS